MQASGQGALTTAPYQPTNKIAKDEIFDCGKNNLITNNLINKRYLNLSTKSFNYHFLILFRPAASISAILNYQDRPEIVELNILYSL